MPRKKKSEEDAKKRTRADAWLKPGKLSLLRGWAKEGDGYEDIAKKMHISRSTLSVWREKYPDIENALEYGREEADYAVEHSLFERCRERTVTVRKMVKIRTVEYDEHGRKIERDEMIPVEEEQVIPADTAAMKYWLSQRCPEKWRSEREPTAEEESGVMLLPEVKECE